ILLYFLADIYDTSRFSLVFFVCCVIQLYSFFFSSRRRHTRSVSAFLLNRSSDLMSIDVVEVVIWRESSVSGGSGAVQMFLRWQQRNPSRSASALSSSGLASVR